VAWRRHLAWRGVAKTNVVAIAEVVRLPLHFAAVSKVCAICGKKPGFGHHRSHSMVATKRRFDPNLQRVRVLLDGKPTRAYVCTRCLKAGKVTKAV